MKVLWLTAAYPSDARPWSGIFVRDLGMALADLSAEITVVTPKIVAGAPSFEQDGPLSVHRFSYLSGGKSFMEQGRIPPVGVASYLASAMWLVGRLARREDYDLAHAHWVLPVGLVGALALPDGLPLVIQARGSDVHTIAEKSRIAHGLAQWTLGQADRVVAPSRGLADLVQRSFGVEEPVDIVHEGVDRDAFQPGDKAVARRALGVPEGIPLAVFVGGLVPVKGLDTLVAAAAKLVESRTDVRVALVGAGPLEDELRAQCNSLGLENTVLFAGSQDQQGVLAWLRAADVAVMPSYEEGLGRAALEAQSVGVPVVASAVGGLPEVVDPGINGLLVPPRAPEALAQALESVFADVDLRNRLRKGALAKAPMWSVQAKASDLHELYKELLAAKVAQRLTATQILHSDHYGSDYYRTQLAERERGTRWHRTRIDNILLLAKPKAGEEILDLGCGIGSVAYEAASRGARVTALDASPEAIKAARALCGDLPVEYVNGDASRVPKPSGSYDKVVCADFLEHIGEAELRAILRECHRVLRPRGTLVIYSPCPTHLFERAREWGLMAQDASHIGLRSMQAFLRALEDEHFDVTQAHHAPSHLPVYSVVERILAPLPGLGQPFRRRICLVAARQPSTEAPELDEAQGAA